MTSIRTRLTAMLALALVLAAAGCGSKNTSQNSSTGAAASSANEPSPSAGSGTTLSLTAEPSRLRFDKDSLSAKAGIVTIKMSNLSPSPHNIGITGGGLAYKCGATVRKGGTSTLTVKLKPGTYEFLCGIGGHEGAGMSGTLVVH
jgi:plastocyanin